MLNWYCQLLRTEYRGKNEIATIFSDVSAKYDFINYEMILMAFV